MRPAARPLLSTLMLLVGTGADAQEWTRFRGPNGCGVSDARGIPTSFGEKDFAWKVKLPGEGNSQPVFWGRRIFVTSAPADGSQRIISCLDAADGSELWQKSYPSQPYKNHERSNYASSTPVVDEHRVYAAFAQPRNLFVVALDHDGNEKWSSSLGYFVGDHGFAASPIIVEDMLVLPCEQMAAEGIDSPSFVVALEAKTGQRRWKTPRRSGTTAYSTPCVLERGAEGPALLFTSEEQGIHCLDARSGKPLWEAGVFDKRCVSSPVIAAGLVVGTCGSGGGGNYLVALRPGGSGDVTETHVLYKIAQSAPYVPTPVAKGKRLFLWADKGGIVSCVEAATGNVLWRGRADGEYSASPILIEDRLYSINHDGECVVVGTGDKFEVLARNPIGELSRTAPSVAHGRLYLRTLRHLIAVRGAEASPVDSKASGG